MNGNLYVAALLIACSLVLGCSEDVTGPAYFEIEEGERLPCLGVKRLRVIVTDGKSKKVLDNFGDYYDQEGHCNLPIYLTAAFGGLNTDTMMVRVEGYDSSEKRIMSLGTLGPIGKSDADKGYLGKMVINREPIPDYEGGAGRYSIGTLVLSPLPQIDEVDNIDSLAFIINPGTSFSLNGRFLTDPDVTLKETELVVSSVQPFDDHGSFIIVARYKNVSVAEWKNSIPFDVSEGDMFVEVMMVKDP